MKMTSKLKRINIQDRSSYETTQFQKSNYFNHQLTPEKQKIFDNLDEYSKVIYPYQQYYSKNKQKNYYLNTLTQKTQWELPDDVKNRVELYFSKKLEFKKNLKQKNFEKFIGSEYLKKNSIQNNEWKNQDAKIQKIQILNQEIAYEEGDEEYNIWYDKKIKDEIIPQRDGAKQKCNPFIDSGITQADLLKNQNFFCYHFSKGNCYQGKNCQFYHHIPNLEECLKIENSKDIFGRARFASHRKDNMGIGNYLKETRTLKITDFCIPTQNENYIIAGYELLYRHFSAYGEIEDIFLIPTDNIAFIRYQHRCMAEFTKECLSDQCLDSDEVLTIQWCDEDCFEIEEAKYQELQDTLDQQKLKQQEEQNKGRKKKKPINPRNPDKKIRSMKEYEQEQEQLKQLDLHFKTKTNDPSKQLLQAEYKLFEQKLQSKMQNQERLNKCLRKLNGNKNHNLDKAYDFVSNIFKQSNNQFKQNQIQDSFIKFIFTNNKQ